MLQRYGVRSTVRHARVVSPRMSAFAAATLLATSYWMVACAWAADRDAPVASPPTSGAGIERGGADLPSGPPMREDDPAIGEEQRTPEAGETGRSPFLGGCPYRGSKTLELIV